MQTVSGKWYVSQGMVARRLDSTGIDPADIYHGKEQLIFAGPFDDKAKAKAEVEAHKEWQSPLVWQKN